LVQLLVFLDDTDESGVIGSIPRILGAFETTAGSMLLVRAVIGTAIFVSVVRNATLTSKQSYVLAGLYLFALAYVGHSRSMSWPVLGVPVDVVHTASVSVWLGGLALFALFVAPNLSPEHVLDGFRRFGRVAQWAVTLIVATGIVQTLRLHTTLVTLLTESHGRWLVLKLVVVAAMLKVGDINRRRMITNLPATESAVTRHVALVRRASLTEVAAGGVVMLLTTVLVTSSFN
jgi:putative copper export protein